MVHVDCMHGFYHRITGSRPEIPVAYIELACGCNLADDHLSRFLLLAPSICCCLCALTHHMCACTSRHGEINCVLIGTQCCRHFAADLATLQLPGSMCASGTRMVVVLRRAQSMDGQEREGFQACVIELLLLCDATLFPN